MEYNFIDIEKKWQQKWVENKTYKVVEDENKQKFYVLNCMLDTHWVILQVTSMHAISD